VPLPPADSLEVEMRIRRWLPRSTVAFAIGALACSSDSGSGGDTAAAVPTLVVDRNHDGLADERDVTVSGLAYALANLDDDDGNGRADFATEALDGDVDAKDLAPLVILGATVPDGTSGVLRVNAEARPHVRLHRRTGATGGAADFTPLPAPTDLIVTTQELKDGVRFGLEVDSLAGMTDWTGEAQFALTVSFPDGTVRTSTSDFKVAPLILQWNTAPTDRVFYVEAGTYNDDFIAGLAPMCAATGAQCTPIALPFRAFDQWVQDFFDLGWTSFPGADGTPVGMKVILRSAQPDRLSGEAMLDGLTKDVAAISIHGPQMDDAAGTGYSMNSFGNWEVVPPYSTGEQRHPLGRNVWGSGADAANQPDPLFVRFIEAQGAQAPLTLDSSWLIVGHIDEFSMFVKAGTARGWRLLAARPSLARQMLLDLQAAGHGSKRLFEGKQVYDFEGPDDTVLLPAAVTIDELLANAELMAESQRAEVEIAEAVERLRTEAALAEDEITPMPFLFERVWGSALAHQPGTVNLLHVGDEVAVPKPHGPVIDGVDPFEVDLTTRLGALGLQVRFIENWQLYHSEMGEVHCGTNASRDVNVAWWEAP
jgi:protein-arginine deiminase